jgi:hypothetical protein
MEIVHSSDDLMKCDPPPGCEGCDWRPVAERVCSGVCISDERICPWLLACRCLNSEMDAGRGQRLERLVMQQPPNVQVASAAIPQDLVRLGEYEIRRKRSEDTICQIAASIVDNGLFAPPGGVAMPSGHIDIMMGGNRVLAMTALLEWAKIPVRIFHWWGNNVWERKIAALQENTLRQQMTLEEEVALIYSYWRQTGMTVREMATRFRMSKSWIQERMAWGKRVYGEGKVPHPDAVTVELQKLKRKQPPRITLPKAEVKAWLDQLHELGVVPEDGNGNVREGLRLTMQALIERLEDGEAS